jgi:hypothetical protein
MPRKAASQESSSRSNFVRARNGGSPMAKVGFEHHGQWTSVSARKMLSCRGARKANLVHKANGWKHQKRIAAFGLATPNVELRSKD